MLVLRSKLLVGHPLNLLRAGSDIAGLDLVRDCVDRRDNATG
jgi:hypothetical protein